MAKKYLSDVGLARLIEKVRASLFTKANSNFLSTPATLNLSTAAALMSGLYTINDGSVIGLANTWWHIIHMRHQDNNGFNAQIAIPLNGGTSFRYRTSNGTVWGAWTELADKSVATVALNGLMSATDKQKLDNIAAGATKITVNNTLTSTSTTEALSAAQGKALNDALAGKAASNHGNHVPAAETANNARFLRNDNTWQTVTPANISAEPARTLATQTEAEAGTSTTVRSWSPLLVAQAAKAAMGSVMPPYIPFANATWEQVNAIAQAGYAPIYWFIGDTKKITLSTSEIITVRIEDFDHDTLTSGGKAKITLGMVDCLNTIRNMNSTNTNVGGWGSSGLRTFMTTLLGQFPSNLQGVIKQVKKTQSAGNQSSSLTATDDKLWPFSYTEVNLPVNASLSPGGEGTTYPLFISDASRVKKVNGAATAWWLRSPPLNNTTSFCCINNVGTSLATTTVQSLGVACGFCI